MDQYAVIGHPIAHSRSPFIHQAFAKQCGQNLTYRAELAPLDRFEAHIQHLRNHGLMGANITVPFKLRAYALATHLTSRAQAAQAVNTLKFSADGTLLGDNTDGIGLVRDIKNNLNFSLHGKRILLVGAGGAARGAILPILEELPAQLIIANRTPQKAAALIEAFSGTPDTRFAASEFNTLSGPFDLIINATSSSLVNEAPPLPSRIYAPRTLAYDMMYASTPTAFLRAAREKGVQHLADGLGMLVEQAAESFYLWRGVRPETQPVLSSLRQTL